jgi:hypothetical protein
LLKPQKLFTAYLFSTQSSGGGASTYSASL